MNQAQKKQPATDWARAFTTPETPPSKSRPELVDATDATPEKKPADRKAEPRGSYKVVKVEKKPQTFRLPPDVFELIEKAQAEAAAAGNRLTNDDAITQAVRGYYGRRRRRS